jgi:hypothetical protein
MAALVPHAYADAACSAADFAVETKGAISGLEAQVEAWKAGGKRPVFVGAYSFQASDYYTSVVGPALGGSDWEVVLRTPASSWSAPPPGRCIVWVSAYTDSAGNDYVNHMTEPCAVEQLVLPVVEGPRALRDQVSDLGRTHTLRSIAAYGGERRAGWWGGFAPRAPGMPRGLRCDYCPASIFQLPAAARAC